MTTLLEQQQHETVVFSTVMAIEMEDRDHSLRGGWRSETRLEILAHEIVRYSPDLAQMLVESGLQQLRAA
jgi:hypothetical protein